MPRRPKINETPLFPVPEPSQKPRQAYDPLPSVWFGDDAELLEKMLDFYPRKQPKRILDATVNQGRFWVGSSRPVVGMDINPRYKPDVVGDNRPCHSLPKNSTWWCTTRRTSRIRARTA